MQRFFFNRRGFSSYGPDGAAGEGAPAPTPAPTPAPNQPQALVIQATQVDEILKNPLIVAKVNQINRSEREQRERLATQLEQLQQSKTLTDQEKADLETGIQNLRSTLQTTEQQQTEAMQKLQTKLDNTTKTKDSEISFWKSRYDSTLMSVDIAKAAQKYKAFNVEQLEALLIPMTKVVETPGEDGRPSGVFAPTVTFTKPDKDGKPVQLKITVDEAVKLMTEMPEKYGNLFRSDAEGGLGYIQSSNGGGGPVDLNPDMSYAEYEKNRDRVMGAMK